MCGRLFLVLFLFLCLGIAQAQTKGTLSISVTTSSTGGNYAPRNVLAIWVEDSSGKFVKTLIAYADKRKTHLNTWESSTTAAGSVYNSVDAITGATKSSHATRTCSWDGTDYNKKIVPDGDYKIRMELTDKNATGNTASFPFTKGPVPQKITPKDVPSFSSVTITWTNSTTAIRQEQPENRIEIYPNPGSGWFTVRADQLISLKVNDIAGRLICHNLNP